MPQVAFGNLAPATVARTQYQNIFHIYALFLTAFIRDRDRKKSLQRLVKLSERLLIDAVARFFSIHSSFDQPGLQQLFQVLGYGALGKRQHFHNLAADAGLVARQYF
jgi:hypothetical protein